MGRSAQVSLLAVVLGVVGRLGLELGWGVSHPCVRHACCELQRLPLLVRREPGVLQRGGLR